MKHRCLLRIQSGFMSVFTTPILMQVCPWGTTHNLDLVTIHRPSQKPQSVSHSCECQAWTKRIRAATLEPVPKLCGESVCYTQHQKYLHRRFSKSSLLFLLEPNSSNTLSSVLVLSLSQQRQQASHDDLTI